MTSRDPNIRSRMTERELADLWRVTPRTLQRWHDEGCGPGWLRIGGRILYMRDEVLDYERRRREPRQ